MASANVSLMDFSEDELESFLSGRSTDKASATTTTGLQLLADAAALGNGVVDGESTRQQDGDGRHGVAVGEYAGLFAVAPHSTPAPQRSPALPDASLAPDTAAPVVPVPTNIDSLHVAYFAGRECDGKNKRTRAVGGVARYVRTEWRVNSCTAGGQ